MPDPRHRFEELDAGRALGDLDQEEFAEWESLSAEFGIEPDFGLDLLAAELEADSSGSQARPLPSDLATKLKAGIQPSSSNEEVANDRKITIGPWLGWAAAACLLGLLTIQKMLPDPSPDQQRLSLLEETSDASQLTFKGNGETYTAAGGEVVWSDLRQEGYLTLTNLPVNDPSINQYQLWIVDPERDEFPVDGGVFDILPGTKSVVIPIDAKLAVKNPAAFVITLEQPGGVVRSKQEVVVAIANS